MFAILLLLLNIVSAQSATPAISVSILNQDPDPVNPGNYVDLRFKISNTMADSIAKSFEVRIEPNYPFSLDDGEEAVKFIGDLPATGDKNVVIVKYRVRVDDDAVEGDSPIKFSFKHDGTDWITQEVNINIQTLDATLTVVSVTTNPKKVAPGERAELAIEVKNMADSTIKDITLKLDLTYEGLREAASTVTASDSIAAFNSLPFAPVESATEKKIYSLSPAESHIFTYSVVPFSDAEAGVYKIPIKLNYYDELQTQYTKNDVIGLVVGAIPDLSVMIDDTELYTGNPIGEISVKIVNKGTTDVKFLNVHLDDTEEYEILSASEVYIGNVDSDDFETAEFKLYLNGNAKKETTLKLPVKLEYKDPNSEVYTMTKDLDLHILSSKKSGNKESNPLFKVAFVFVILGLGYYFYKKKKLKKK